MIDKAIRQSLFQRCLSLALVTAPIFMFAAPAAAAELLPETIKAFNRYVSILDRVFDRRSKGEEPFLELDRLPRGRLPAQQGRIIIKQYAEEVAVPGGLVTDWYGAMFIPDVTGEDAIQVLQAYDRHSEIYEEVVRSKLLSRDGDRFKTHLRLQKGVAGLNIALNTEHEVEFVTVAENRWGVRVRSTRIAELENVDEPDEKELPVGNDSGFLWRMTTYWAWHYWIEQRGADPARNSYPPIYHQLLIPPGFAGKYNVPGYAGNGLPPYEFEPDPIAASGNIYYKGFFNFVLGLYRYVSGNDKYDREFDLVYDDDIRFSYRHSTINEIIAKQIMENVQGVNCEVRKIWPM